MPTGYTADVQSGKITEFEDFALQCARAFGALATMRDEAADALVPQEFVADTARDDEKIEQYRREIAIFETMTPDECQEAALKAYPDACAANQEREEQRRQYQRRFEAMLDKVVAWSPPTDDHFELKKFMVKQLRESIRFDCLEGFGDILPDAPASGDRWRMEQLFSAERALNYHLKSRADNIRRAAERTAWVNHLRLSLKTP